MPGNLNDAFPAIAAWIQDAGWVEIGDQESVGFVAMALDRGGMVFEDRTCETLDECMRSLERGLRDHMRGRWGDEF